MKDLRTAALIAPIEVPATILNVDLPFLPRHNAKIADSYKIKDFVLNRHANQKKVFVLQPGNTKTNNRQ